MRRPSSPLSPKAAAATKVKCQCGHPRGIHFLRRKTHTFTLCRYCTCQEFIEGPLRRFPKYQHEEGFNERLPERIEGVHNVKCIECGKRKRCKDGRICTPCCKEADELVGL
jgi:hypothetical protein